VHEKDRLIQLFVTDLEKLVTEVDPSYWRDAIRQLYRTYVKRGTKENGARDVPDRCVCVCVCVYLCVYMYVKRGTKENGASDVPDRCVCVCM
jgi:hypothetical protein